MDNSADRKKTIVMWDVGAVLVRLTYSRFYEEGARLYNRYNLEEAISAEEFGKRFATSGIEARQVAGKSSTKDFLSGLAELISPKMGLEESLELVMNCWGEPIDENIEIKRRVHKAGYSVGILSNMSQLAWIVLAGKNRKMFSTYESSSPVLMSYRLGMLKPEPEIYKLVSGYNKLVFVDDKIEYLEYPVRELGWKGIWFKGFIDPTETMRLVQEKSTGKRQNKDIRIADTPEQIVSTLAYFGIEI